MTTAIDQLLSLRPLPWDLVVEFTDGKRWEYECADPAVAIMKLEEVLSADGVSGVRRVAITFEASIGETVEA